MLDHLEIWKLLAGLGIFLFGIYLMEDSIKGLAGRSFKQLLRRYTSTRLSAILTGLSTTAILQSSSAITLMILAFVGAGIMHLEHAISVILGSNIGTTITAWIVAVFGFKMSIESFALPLIAIGGIGLIFSRQKPKLTHLNKLLIGFGFLFHGLDYMKGSVEQATRLFDVEIISGFGLWLFVLTGTILTALMQSSSATIAIILTAVSTGIIGLNDGAAMVIGANVGTTITVLLGATGGTPNKKRVAYSHLIFNLVTAVVAFLLIPLYVWIIETGIGMEQVVLEIALSHTMFNLIGVLIFLPFIPLLTTTVTRLFPEPVRMVTHYIQNTAAEVSEAAIPAFRKEILHQYKESRNYLVIKYNLSGCGLLQHAAPLAKEQNVGKSADEFYRVVNELHGEIFEYYSRIVSGELESGESKVLDLYLRASRSIMNATMNLKEIQGDLESFELSDSKFLNHQASLFKTRMEEFILNLDPLLENDQTEDIDIENFLDETFKMVETRDAECIRESSVAIRKGQLKDTEATTMLMANRLFTQSCRMIVLSLKSLLLHVVDTDRYSNPVHSTL